MAGNARARGAVARHAEYRARDASALPPRALRTISGRRWMGMRDGSDGKVQARRRFLGGVGLAAVAAPAAAFEQDGSTGGLAPKKETEAEKRQPRYRETDHVRNFYRTNRY
jgi:hypothetical protein